MKCFFLVSIAGSKPRKIVFELFRHICPKTCQNFASFCESSHDIKSYRGTFFHRIIPGFMVQGGDYEKNDGSGGHAFDGGTLSDESFFVKHSEPGILSMANRGKDTGGSQFFITTGKASHLDGKHVAFGRVIEGMQVVYDMEKVETDEKDMPIFQKVKIVDCGVGDGSLNHSDDASSYISEHKSRKKHSKKKKSRASNSSEDDESSSRKYRKRKKHKKKKHRSEDYITSNSRSDDDSYDRRDRKKSSKDDKHTRKRKKSKYDSSDESSDISRDKKSRRRRNRSTSHDSSSKLSLKEVTFGKYGIIREADLMSNSKIKRSFEIWLEEVKRIPSGSSMSRFELSNYFKDYVEDFNTVTLPHQKYYDYDKWEMQEYLRQKEDSHAKSSILADEFEHREEMRRKAEEKKRKEFENIKLLMSKDKVEEMKNQARLKAELANAYRLGDEETRKRLQKRLEHDDKK